MDRMTYSKSKLETAKKKVREIRRTARRKSQYPSIYFDIKEVYEYCMDNINWTTFHIYYAGPIVDLRETVNADLNHERKVTIKEYKEKTRMAINYLKWELEMIENCMKNGEVDVTD